MAGDGRHAPPIITLEATGPATEFCSTVLPPPPTLASVVHTGGMEYGIVFGEDESYDSNWTLQVDAGHEHASA